MSPIEVLRYFVVGVIQEEDRTVLPVGVIASPSLERATAIFTANHPEFDDVIRCIVEISYDRYRAIRERPNG